MRVAILGCGYVGLELARQLRDVHDVFGVRRSTAGLEAVETTGATPVEADLTDANTYDRIPDVDHLVFAASTGGRGADAARELYVSAQQSIRKHFEERSSPPDRYIYTSSTGVYGDHDGAWVDEETTLDPRTDKTRALAAAERVVLPTGTGGGTTDRENRRRGSTGSRRFDDEQPVHFQNGTPSTIDGTVVRLAGLYGPNRYRLERYLNGPVTEGYRNIIHRDDAAGVIGYLLEADLARNEVVLGVDDEPVDRWEFADWVADECGLDAPPKQTVAERLEDDSPSSTVRRRIRTNKRCSNDKLHRLGYSFQYPTFRDGYRAAIERYCTG